MQIRHRIGVDGHKIVGHNTAAAINRALVNKRCELQRIRETDTVGMQHFTVLHPVEEITVVFINMASFVRFLNAPARGRIISGNS
ncbi:hypothetical protein SDC9_186049 [bioreactor metagenome]|uniref:Uncharacterized protein n=1 Tax=bioreactor metagenome TaxID=1076179 RepID=A0A645HHL2_9ZZZZ